PEIELPRADQSAWVEQPVEREHHSSDFVKAQSAGELQPQQWDFTLIEQLSRHRGEHVHTRAKRDDRADTELDQDVHAHFPALFFAQPLPRPERVFEFNEHRLATRNHWRFTGPV